MAEESKEVLRSIFIPIDMDRRLREVSFSRLMSKSDLILSLIADGLKRIEESDEKTIAEFMDSFNNGDL